jgi:uncharacterized protein (DUF2235 family)
LPKNIVLFSDGTGNSAAKEFKTNVWRFYQAIDINPPKTANEPHQVVFYDDGVGSENFRPLAYLGLALGFGLAQNVKDLYTFLCRNYAEGDNIFLIGFSRGAFTVRVLAGMIARCGLVHAENEEELREQVAVVYNEYKWDAARRATGTNRALLLGWLFGGYKKADLNYVPLGDKIKQRFPRIAFIGVWDTVDAYGMPVDEIKLAIDRYIWPMTLADRNLSSLVDRACHALSLDDERSTFRPVLWNEVRDGDPVDGKQLTQVWFVGVHANVGGGYPDDGLAHVAQQWMMDEARKQGLWFYDQSRLRVDSRANAHGKQYDSRSGIAGYYRYGPRDVDALCDDPNHGVRILKPKVHASAIKRIESWEVAYAPVSFPSDYDVMDRRGGRNPDLVRIKGPESDSQRDDRGRDMQAAWAAVARRRQAYLATVWLTAVLVGLPLADQYVGALAGSISALITEGGDTIRAAPTLLRAFSVDETRIDSTIGAVTTAEGWISRGVGYLQSYLGGWSKPWLGWYQRHPLFFLVLVLPLIWLFLRKSPFLQDEVFKRADYAWRRIREPAKKLAKQNEPMIDPVGWLQRNEGMRKSYSWFNRWIVSFVVAIPIGIVIAAVALLFFLPSSWRLYMLRRKYKVGPTAAKPGTDERAPIIKRRPCRVQRYNDPGRRRG